MSTRPAMATSVLVVDDDESARNFCSDVLRDMGLEVQSAASGREALNILENGRTDIVLLDLVMPGLSGLEFLKILKHDYVDIDVVMMTGYGSIPSAVEVTKLGAYDYLTKPFKPDDLQNLIRRLVEKQALAAEINLLREQVKVHEGFASLIGTSAKMQKIYRMILKVAPKRHPVLVLGESGTGKELVARAIHNYSPWHDKPFVPVDCGGLTPTLIESELFGHVRGAFTGATQTRPGLLATARGGTVFLDEIAELPVELQAKLLRALQEREIKPLGTNQRTRLDARVIVATNQDLEAAIKRGTFRKDLYFRLHVVSIKIPPLRERKNDIPALAHYFMDKYGGSENAATGISYEAMSRLMSYDWPGNVRELENCIQRALALGSGPLIQVRDLPSNLLYRVGRDATGGGVLSLKELERKAILQALEAARGDRVRAAKLLGIGKTTIYRKLKEYGIEEESKGAGAQA
ncbi:MAG: sigma-54-dependent Fis family transcriptional regulator [Acidobacteria bacterium]|nr:sigma-54-dependent Fis family transcriptional regulator [Acidobacteriota bacterium]